MSIIRRVNAGSKILTPRFAPHLPRTVNRRAFLRGASAVAIGLPFLESLQSHSAWAQSGQPVFSLWICVANGIVGRDFHPSESGALSAGNLGKNTAVLADYVNQISLIRGIRYNGNLSNCGHAQGACQVLTGTSHSGGGNTATSTNESADTLIASQLNGGRDPIALYSGLKEGYINERLSFVRAGQVRPAESSPKNAFQRIFDQASEEAFGGGTAAPAPAPTPEPGEPATQAPMLDDLTKRRKSVVDLVREELLTLNGRMGLNATDKQRLDVHLSSLREIEMATAPTTDPTQPTEPTRAPTESCSADAVNAADFDTGGVRSGEDQERVAKLHIDISAFAFACNVNRTATLQIGDGTDHTVYSVPNNGRSWKFHHISHRTQSDAVSGQDSTAEAAHSEIDKIRMETLLHGIRKFEAYGLLDTSFIMWTSHISDGPTHSFNDIPYVIAGSGGGYLKLGQAINATNTTNNRLLNTLISAAGVPTESFGGGQGGHLDALRA